MAGQSTTTLACWSPNSGRILKQVVITRDLARWLNYQKKSRGLSPVWTSQKRAPDNLHLSDSEFDPAPETLETKRWSSSFLADVSDSDFVADRRNLLMSTLCPRRSMQSSVPCPRRPLRSFLPSSMPRPQCLRRTNCAHAPLATRIAIQSKSWRCLRRNFSTNQPSLAVLTTGEGHSRVKSSANYRLA